jgi:EthD domain
MEKLVFLLLGPEPTLGAAEASSLRSQVVPALQVVGGVSGVQLNLTDAALGHPFGVAPEEGTDQILASVYVWVDSAEASTAAVVRALGSTAGDAAWHGWLVCESEPLPNRDNPPGPDGLVPGFAQIVALSRPAHLSWVEWRQIWQGAHTTVAMNTQSTFRYVQNVVFRALTPGAPAYAAVVEECFPPAAATDMHVFFNSGGDQARLSRHMAAMSESCDRFMDGSAPVSWTREWVFGGPGAAVRGGGG